MFVAHVRVVACHENLFTMDTMFQIQALTANMYITHVKIIAAKRCYWYASAVLSHMPCVSGKVLPARDFRAPNGHARCLQLQACAYYT